MSKQTRMPETVHAWQDRYHQLLDSLNIGVMLFTPDYVCLRVNEAVLRMTGRPQGDFENHHAQEWFGAEEYQSIYRTVAAQTKRAISDRTNIFQFESFAYDAAGEKIPLLCSVSFNFNARGRHESIWLLLTDIRDLKKTQIELEAKNRALMDSRNALSLANRWLKESRNALVNEKKKLETILFGIGECVAIFDQDGSLMLSNPQGMAILGERRTPLLPLAAGAQKEVQVKVNDDWHRFSAQVFEILDDKGNAYAYAEILRDITDRKKLEEREQELFRVKREMRRLSIKSEMIGGSRAMQPVYDTILRCGEVDSSILVLGETGVGKELAARAIHAHSSRKNKPFVAINCGALPETLLESELFGHVKGAFTGAISDRLGLFREAQGGTLFLDEVGDLSLPLQVKLLRALQEREIRPLGGNRSYAVDVRIITATHHDLAQLVVENRFRRDLYYRIAVIPLLIPPLRERRDDILLLAEHFIKKHGGKNLRKSKSLNHAAQGILMAYPWPGNIRELENCIEHALAMSPGLVIPPEALPVQIVSWDAPQPHAPASLAPPPDSPVTAVDHRPATSGGSAGDAALAPWQLTEKQRVEAVLNEHRGNRTRTAAALGISRTTLWRKIAMYRIKG